MRELVRILFLGAIVAFLAFAGGATVYKATAAEVEYDVITAAYEAGLAAETPDELAAAADEAYEIWLDTYGGSYCEQYASVVYAVESLAATVWAGYEATPDDYPIDEPVPYAPDLALLQAVQVAHEQIDVVGNDCLMEGI